jgi:hypothetical protein
MFLPTPLSDVKIAGNTGAPADVGVKDNDTWLPGAPVTVRALKMVELMARL